MNIANHLTGLNIGLPVASDPQGSYCNCVRTDNLLYIYGKDPTVPKGKLGQ